MYDVYVDRLGKLNSKSVWQNLCEDPFSFWQLARKLKDDSVIHAPLLWSFSFVLLLSLSQSNTTSYKSFLLELAHQRDISLPKYKTISVGEPHNLTFFSSVEIKEEIFHGDGAKSKKQAEENAAKDAYITLTKCKYSSAIFFIHETIGH